jgi:DNA-binding winged helix-turn-helix (wHTH) protein/serine/threonine protein kinase
MSDVAEKTRGRVWAFAGCECDEPKRELRVQGDAVDLEPKPFDILLELLEQYPNVVRKEELTATIWEGNTVVPNSLPTAISKLRKALGDEDHTIVQTVPGHGYKIVTEVAFKEIPVGGESVDLKPGDRIAGKGEWSLIRRLGPSDASEVWLAGHPATEEQRVFKFAADGVRLRYLKREAALFRYLKKTLGERPQFLRVLDWNFEQAPYFLEIEFGGPNLAEWAELRGGLDRIPLAERIRMMADIAGAVSLAHGVGVIHRDLKPANVLVSPAPARAGEPAAYQVRIVDFGSGGLLEHLSPGSFDITGLNFSQPLGDAGAEVSTTLMYAAPEVLKGQPPTAAADVYALGVMLFQMVVGDFHRTPLPGWEESISDPLLREDIGLAASGDPEKRFGSVADLTERLSSLELRRSTREERMRAEVRTLAAEQALRQTRARRPWMVTAVALLTVGLAASIGLYIQASHERNRANRQAAIAASINRFVAQDLLARSDPFHSGKSDETLIGAVKRAIPDIDRQFANEPEVAARLHDTIATALARRDESKDAILEYQRAAALFVRASGPTSPDAVVSQLQSAIVEARSFQPDAMARAKKILEEQEGIVHSAKVPRADLPVWLAIVRGTIALIGNDAKVAVEQFQMAVDRARSQKNFDTARLLTTKHALAAALMHLGEAARCEQLAREVLDSYTRIYGKDSAPTLQVRLLLAQALLTEHKHEEAIRQTTDIYPLFVAALGEEHQLTMQVLLTRESAESSLERWDAAIQDSLKVHETAVRKLGALSAVAVMSLSDASQSQCRAGHYDRGTPNARAAFESARKAFGEHGGITDATAYALANCLMGSTGIEEASRLLDGIDPATLAQLTGDNSWPAEIALAKGQIAYRRGDIAAVKQYLAIARPDVEPPRADLFQKHEFETLAAAVAHR